MKSSARLHDAARMRKDANASYYLLLDFLDDLRACRKINVKQWELGRSLADQWHGTAEDFVTAVKELA
jgi:hypothetical protein